LHRIQTFYLRKFDEFSCVIGAGYWKSKITEQYGPGNIILANETQCRIDSDTMVNIIVPNVMSFLSDGGCDDIKFLFRNGGSLDELSRWQK
jgi:hypothetical protein